MRVCNRPMGLLNPIVYTIGRDGLPSPLLVVMVVTKGSLGVGVASIGVLPWGLPHLWESIGWQNF